VRSHVAPASDARAAYKQKVIIQFLIFGQCLQFLDFTLKNGLFVFVFLQGGATHEEGQEEYQGGEKKCFIQVQSGLVLCGIKYRIFI
jgi:hypothetical protein